MAKRTLEYRRVSDLLRAPTNSKGHDAAGIRASIERFGFVGAIVLDERTGCLIEGHGRLDELERRKGADEPAPEGVEVDDDGEWTVPLVRGWSSENDEEAEAFGIAANQLVIAGGFDGDALVEQLMRVQSTPLSFAGIGFDSDELGVMLAGLQGGDAMPTNDGFVKAAQVDTTVAFRFGDYSGKVQRDVYDRFLKVFETLRESNDAVMLDEVLVAWLKL